MKLQFLHFLKNLETFEKRKLINYQFYDSNPLSFIFVVSVLQVKQLSQSCPSLSAITFLAEHKMTYSNENQQNMFKYYMNFLCQLFTSYRPRSCYFILI